MQLQKTLYHLKDNLITFSIKETIKLCFKLNQSYGYFSKMMYAKTKNLNKVCVVISQRVVDETSQNLV